MITSIFKTITVFSIGIIECFLISLNTKLLQKNKKILCFITSFINILVWYKVILLATDKLQSIYILPYALGFATGNVLAIIFDSYLDKVIQFKRRKKHIIRRKK